MAIIAPNPKWQVFNNGAIGAGCKLHTYDAGTDTPRPTYTSPTQAVEHTNPVVFDSRGEAVIYFNGSYKLVLKDPNGVTLWTVDSFDPSGSDQNVAYDNLIQNGSFETLGTGSLPANWDITLYTNGTGVRVTDSVYHGGYALKFTSAGSGGGQAIGSAFTECSEGMPMSLMFAIRSDVADVRNVVEIYWYDKNQAQLAGGSAKTTLYDDAATNPTAWTVYRYFPIPPADARFCKVRLVGCDSSDATVGNTWFDGVSLGDVPLVNSSGVLYFPGDATITGVFKTGDGSAAAPSVRRTATADGLFWAAGVVGVSIGGVEKGRFTSTGLNGCAIGATTAAAGAFTTGAFSSTLGVTGDFAVATNKFTVAAASGNTSVAGTLTTTGVHTANGGVAGALNGTVGATTPAAGAFTTLTASGDFAVATNKFTVAAASGNTSVAGTLTVSTAGGNISWGTYTPTVTAGSNYSSSSLRGARYTRIGNIVTVFVWVDITATSTSTETGFELSLPIVSNLGSYDLVGSGVAIDGTNPDRPLRCVAYATGDTANNKFFTGTAQVLNYCALSFSYTIS